MLEDGSVISAIIEKRNARSLQHALLIGISGIDAAGKGFVTARIAESLQERGLELAVINADGWLNLPHVRFHRQDSARHFYENAIRFDEMFERVILPTANHTQHQCGIGFRRGDRDDLPQASLRFFATSTSSCWKEIFCFKEAVTQFCENTLATASKLRNRIRYRLKRAASLNENDIMLRSALPRTV
jgi:hypothetical protein